MQTLLQLIDIANLILITSNELSHIIIALAPTLLITQLFLSLVTKYYLNFYL